MQINDIFVVGCGGIAAHVIPTLVCTHLGAYYTLIDGDKVERKNLARQLMFNIADVGRAKSTAVNAKIASRWATSGREIAEYLDVTNEDQLGIIRADVDTEDGATPVILCCADNHAARNSSLRLADILCGVCCIAANEAVEAEAYWYDSQWKGSARDPRIYYPQITTDKSYDPLQAVHCSDAAEQTILANMLAGAQMLWLLRLWTSDYMETLRSKVDTDSLALEVYNRQPYRFRSALGLWETVGDKR